MKILSDNAVTKEDLNTAIDTTLAGMRADREKSRSEMWTIIAVSAAVNVLISVAIFYIGFKFL
jgi:small basic protein